MGRPRADDKLVSIAVTVTPGQRDFLRTLPNQSEYIRRLIEADTSAGMLSGPDITDATTIKSTGICPGCASRSDGKNDDVAHLARCVQCGGIFSQRSI